MAPPTKAIIRKPTILGTGEVILLAMCLDSSSGRLSELGLDKIYQVRLAPHLTNSKIWRFV